MQTEIEIVKILKTIYDSEIPVNIYDLGLIYQLNIDDDDNVSIDMTLTAPGCPVADSLTKQVEAVVRSVDGVRNAHINLVWEPPWDQSRMSEEAQLELGLF